MYTIVIAISSFKCPICGTKVHKGENCMDFNGNKTCLCQMPARRLRKIETVNK